MEGMVFKNLFTQEEGLETFCLKGRFPRMVEDEMEMLRKDITEEENRIVVFHMGSYEAPGEDGYQPTFYQSQWEVVEISLCETIRNLFRSPAEVKRDCGKGG